MFINVGALDSRRNRFKTKKALATALAEDPTGVLFDRTSVYDAEPAIPGDDIPEDAILSVVGPDPYGNRKWYANVRRGPDGSVRIA